MSNRLDILSRGLYIPGMATALRDAQPWRRSLAEHGLSYEWLAERTGKSPSTVQAYALAPGAKGYRRAPAEWIALAEAVIAEHERTAA